MQSEHRTQKYPLIPQKKYAVSEKQPGGGEGSDKEGHGIEIGWNDGRIGTGTIY